MVAVLAAGFLITHGLIHVAIWAPPSKVYAEPDGKAAGPPFVPSHSWMLSGTAAAEHRARVIAVALASVAGALLVLAGVGVAVGTSWWPSAALAGAGAGLVLKAVYFDRWLVIGILLDLGVIAAVAAGWPSSLY
jgi:hypothetical protein